MGVLYNAIDTSVQIPPQLPQRGVVLYHGARRYALLSNFVVQECEWHSEPRVCPVEAK